MINQIILIVISELSPDRTCNSTNNPMIYTLWDDDNKTKPIYVVALIEKRHLKFGQSTRQNRKLAAVIRSRGIIGENGKHLDQCGHIIAKSLGGLMKFGNLIPQGKTTNLEAYRCAERIIHSHVDNQNKKNPRALVQVGLVYGDEKYPYRPTRFYYSYLLYDDSGEERKNDQNTDQPKYELAITVGGKTVIIESGQVVKARTRSIPNRAAQVAQRYADKAFWFQIAAAATAILTSALVPFPLPKPILNVKY